MAIAYRHLFQNATLNNDGSTRNINGDYSSTPGSFQIVSANVDLIINRVLISIEDGTINSADVYGGLGGALSNGIILRVKDSNDNTIYNITPTPITTNGEWAAACYDFDVIAGFSTGNDYAVVRWTFSRSGHPIVLKGGSGDYIEVYAQDNFTGLDQHRFFFQGYYQINYR